MAEFTSLNGYTVKDVTARNIAKGRNQALSYSNYATMISTLNAMDKEQLKTGQNIYIGTVGVPDLWVYSVETTLHNFSYSSDNNIVELLENNGTIQSGYYKLAALEGQKVDMTEYDTKLAEHDTKLASFESTKSDIVGSPLGVALGMSTGDKWADVVSDIVGVSNNGAVNKSITPSDATQTYTIPKGYHNGSGKVTVGASVPTVKTKTLSATTVAPVQTAGVKYTDRFKASSLTNAKSSKLSFDPEITSGLIVGIHAQHTSSSQTHKVIRWNISNPTLAISSLDAVSALPHFGLASVSNTNVTLWAETEDGATKLNITVYYI